MMIKSYGQKSVWPFEFFTLKIVFYYHMKDLAIQHIFRGVIHLRRVFVKFVIRNITKFISDYVLKFYL